MRTNIKRTRWGLPVVLALVLRLLFIGGYKSYPPFLGDDAGYEDVGWNLSQGRGFVTTSSSSGSSALYEPLIAHGPVYPAFLGGIYFLFGHSLTAVRIVQAFLGSVLVFLVFWVARIAFGEEVSFLSALFTAIHPALLIYSGMLLTETLFTLMLVLSVWMMLEAVRYLSWYQWVGTGIVLGLTILLREETIFLAFLMVGWILWAKEEKKKGMAVFLLGIGLLLSVGPWTIRNFLIFKDVILVSETAGRNLWISTVGWDEFRNEEPYRSLALGLPERERHRILLQEGIKNILTDPLRYLRLCFQRIGPFWLGSHTTYLFGFSESFSAYYARGAIGKIFVKLSFFLVNLGLLVLAIGGGWMSLFREKGGRRLWIICLLPIVAVAVVHFFLFATSRYQVPILPFILMFSAVGVERILQKLKFRTSCRTIHIAAFAILFCQSLS